MRNFLFLFINLYRKIASKIRYYELIHNRRYLGYCGKNVWQKNIINNKTASLLCLYDNVHIYESAKFIMTGSARLIMKKNSGASYGLTVITGEHGYKVGEWAFDTMEDSTEDIGKDIVVEEDVRIGANVTLLSGITIGRGSIIGAGAVVDNNVPPYSIVKGNPAKVVGYKFRPTEIIEHERILFPENERISVDILQKNYNDFYGKPSVIQEKAIQKLSVNEYKQLLADVFQVELSEVINLKYKETAEWDSISHLLFISSLEEKYGIKIAPADFMQINSYHAGLEILKKNGIEICEEDLQTEQTASFPEELFDFSSYKKRIAVIDNEKEFSYEDLEKSINDISRHIKQGCLAILLTSNCFESIAFYVACIKRQTPVVLIDSKKDKTLLDNIIESYHPQYIIVPQSRKKEFNCKHTFSIHKYCIGELPFPKYKINPKLSLLLTTSGSTGSPKFVRLTSENIKSNAENIATYLEINKDERAITSLPMYYSYGLSVINSHLIIGACVVVTDHSVIEPEFWEIAKKHCITSMSGVPYTYEMIRKLDMMSINVPSLKTMTQAGGKMSKENIIYFAEKCKSLDRKLIVMYGQTEATARMSYLPWENVFSKASSIGIAIPNGQFNIVDENGNTITEPETAGELVYHGKNVSMGYALNEADLVKGDERNGILYTGDIAKFDNDGFFYIVGRKKRFVKLYGNRVGLDELEQLLSSKFDKMICIGTDRHVYVVTTNKDIEERELLDYINKMTHINKKAFSLYYMEQIPISTSGKILYNEIEDKIIKPYC